MERNFSIANYLSPDTKKGALCGVCNLETVRTACDGFVLYMDSEVPDGSVMCLDYTGDETIEHPGEIRYYNADGVIPSEPGDLVYLDLDACLSTIEEQSKRNIETWNRLKKEDSYRLGRVTKKAIAKDFVVFIAVMEAQRTKFVSFNADILYRALVAAKHIGAKSFWIQEDRPIVAIKEDAVVMGMARIVAEHSGLAQDLGLTSVDTTIKVKAVQTDYAIPRDLPVRVRYREEVKEHTYITLLTKAIRLEMERELEEYAGNDIERNVRLTEIDKVCQTYQVFASSKFGEGCPSLDTFKSDAGIKG